MLRYVNFLQRDFYRRFSDKTNRRIYYSVSFRKVFIRRDYLHFNGFPLYILPPANPRKESSSFKVLSGENPIKLSANRIKWWILFSYLICLISGKFSWDFPVKLLWKDGKKCRWKNWRFINLVIGLSKLFSSLIMAKIKGFFRGKFNRTSKDGNLENSTDISYFTTVFLIYHEKLRLIWEIRVFIKKLKRI